MLLSAPSMSLPFWIALRSLFSRRSRYAYSAIGWIAVIGLMLGVASQSIAVSILGGFEKVFTQSILGFNAHLVLMKEGEIADPEAVLQDLKPFENPEGITHITPFLYREGLIAHHGKVKGGILKGIDPLTFGDVYDVKLRIFSSSSASPPLPEALKNGEGEPKILLGSDLAEYLGVTPEDRTVSILSPQGDLKKIADVNNFKRFEVAGTFSSGLYEYDSQFALLTLSQAQSFFKSEGRVTGFEMRMGAPQEAQEWAGRMEKTFPPPFQIIPWQELNAEIFQALKLEKRLFFLIMGLIVTVAAANLIGLIVISVAHQSGEISILRAMGMRSKKIARIFFWQGMMLSLLGVVLGTMLGAAVSYFLSSHALFSIAKEVYLISSLPISLSWKNFLGVVLFSVGISFLVTKLAARRATQLNLDL